MKIYIYYHNENKTIYDVLTVLENNKMLLSFHGIDRVIEYKDINLEETKFGIRLLYGKNSSLPWKNVDGKINEKWMEMHLDFISLDVETATIDQMICQIGLCIVADKQIIEKKCWLIQPPENKYDWQCVKVHKISVEMTKDLPSFEQVWDEISGYLIGSQIVAHNAANFDEIAIRKNLDYYHIDDSRIKPFIDTISLWGHRIALDELCVGFGWSIEGHHDAQWDAEMCARVYLEYLAGNQPNWQLVEECHVSKGEKTTKSSYINIKDISKKKISGEVLVKDFSNAKPENNPFYDRKIVITGEFAIERKEMAEMLQKYGADVNTSVSKKTNYVLVGSAPGPSKMTKIAQLKEQGYDIRILTEDDFNRIVNGMETEDLSEFMIKN